VGKILCDLLSALKGEGSYMGSSFVSLSIHVYIRNGQPQGSKIALMFKIPPQTRRYTGPAKKETKLTNDLL
jgi:hypothetical protein